MCQCSFGSLFIGGMRRSGREFKSKMGGGKDGISLGHWGNTRWPFIGSLTQWAVVRGRHAANKPQITFPCIRALGNILIPFDERLVYSVYLLMSPKYNACICFIYCYSKCCYWSVSLFWICVCRFHCNGGQHSPFPSQHQQEKDFLFLSSPFFHSFQLFIRVTAHPHPLSFQLIQS